MTNKELELIGQLTDVAIKVAELKAENKILKEINEKLIQALNTPQQNPNPTKISR